MRKRLMVLGLTAAFVLSGRNAIASPGFYLGLEAGSSAPNFSLKNPQLDFEGTTSFLYGAKVGLKFLMFAVEGNVLTASHNITSAAPAFPWEGNGVRFTYWGINGKLFIPLLVVHPYIMGGYGNYSININDIGNNSSKGYNLGVGLEVKLGKLGVFAEGRYHKVTVTIDRELDASNYTLTFGLLYDF